MKTERRWLKSVISAAAEPMPALPWERAAQAQPTRQASTALPHLRQPPVPASRPTAAMAAR